MQRKIPQDLIRYETEGERRIRINDYPCNVKSGSYSNNDDTDRHREIKRKKGDMKSSYEAQIRTSDHMYLLPAVP